MEHERVTTMLVGYRRAINEQISQWIGAEHLGDFYDMMRYQLGLDVHPASEPHPQMCSLLCVLTCEAVGGLGREATGAAAAIELLSGWFQIHRDIEERTSTSHGRPALWTKWSYPQAINTGDGMFPLAGKAMLAAVENPELALTLTRELTDTALSHMEGRYRELTFQDQSNVQAEAHLEAIELTSGALMGFSAWAGAVIGGAGDDTRQELRRFGAGLGVACRLRDDSIVPQLQPGPAETSPRCTTHRSPVTRDRASYYLDTALAALERVAIDRANRQRLAAFARDCVRQS